MAIILTKQPTGIYPAYNDSFIEFYSNFFDAINNLTPIQSFCNIYINDLNPFKIYPNIDGKYIFNFKEIVKILINSNGFEDNNNNNVISDEISVYNDRLITLNVRLDINLEHINDDINLNFEFFKSVKQVGEKIDTNNSKILSKSPNGVDFNLTYFEGYPFFIEIQKVEAGEEIKVINRNNEDDVIFTSNGEGTGRLLIDNVTENLTTSTTLPLFSTINKLEIYSNNIFKNNLKLKKIPSQKGVYLKWYNSDGGYNFYLFDKHYRDILKSKSKGSIARNDFKNLDENPNSSYFSYGKNSSNSIRLKTTVTSDEMYYLKGLISSPSVQYYTSHSPFIKGEWITVNVEGTITELTKKNKNELIISVEFPKQHTMTY